ncbi:putative f-box/lrr-repeat protein [Quercus suber]|uniref:F-box/lrr-repeat protein n=1 Tax=Quercus suber TaxID=58331 RepID=A0AAW0M2C7_QUESU
MSIAKVLYSNSYLNGEDNAAFQHEEDWISQLPDKMLIFVLSFSTPKWKYLSPFLTGGLDFDGLHTMWEIREGMKGLNFEREKSLQWVNHTLKSYQVSTIDEFRVCFEFNDGSKSHVDGWIDFTISKGVKRLELDFPAAESYKPFYKRENLHQVPHIPHSKICTLNWRASGALPFQLSLLLERLHVDHSEDLVNLKIYSSSLKLKYLHIIRCLEFKSIEINAPNLESFGYVGKEIGLHVHSAPRFLDVPIGGMYSHPIYYAFGSLSSFLYQLESLSLNVRYNYPVVKFPEFQILTKLKHLKVAIGTDEGSLLVYLLESAVNLENIVINPCSPYIKGIPCSENVRTTVKYKGAREAAMRLKEKLLTGAEFVIM